MVRNLSRSRRGWVGSWASSRTRWLNSSQLSSLFKYEVESRDIKKSYQKSVPITRRVNILTYHGMQEATTQVAYL